MAGDEDIGSQWHALEVVAVTAVLCGASVTRCTGCSNTVGAGHDTCPRCGAEDFEPSTCRRPALAGQARCGVHGGRAPQTQQAAAERSLEAEAKMALDRLGAKPVDNPLRALQELAGEAVAAKTYFAALVAHLGEDHLRYKSQHGLEQLRSEVSLYERACDRAERVLTAIARLNIDERLAKIDGDRTEAVLAAAFDFLLAVITDDELGFTPEAQTAIRGVAARRLRAGDPAAAGIGALVRSTSNPPS